jgi:hypothetical protein
MSLSDPASNSSLPPIIKVSRRVLVWLSVVWLLPWITLWWWLDQNESPPSPLSLPVGTVSAEIADTSGAEAFNVTHGPWGQLETMPVVIRAPQDLLRIETAAATHITWRFVDFLPEDLDALFRPLTLPATTGDFLLDRTRWEFSNKGIAVRVPKEIVLSLPTDARRAIYNVLGQWTANPHHYAPFSFRAETADEWFENAQLSQATRDLIAPLLFRRGKSLLFSDLPLISHDIVSPRERMELLQALSRSITPLARIRITADSDIDQILDYWSLGQRRRDLEPLLRSLPTEGSGSTLDLIHLLPTLPRRLLYTFPAPLQPGEQLFRDCHWTALNFNLPEVDDRFADIEQVRLEYETAYREVAGDPQLGDLLLFIREDGTVLHAAVHVAADLVFTKNGVGISSPWILMRMSDLLDRYPSDIPFRRQIRRAH